MSDGQPRTIEELRYRFFEIDYERGLDIVHRLHDLRMSYQKFYVGLIASIITVAALLKRLPGASEKGQGNEQDSLIRVVRSVATDEVLIGVLFLLSGFIGYFVVKNLISIRRNEVFWNNMLIEARATFIKDLKLPSTYPSLGKARANDPRSADFQTILACAIINVVIVLLGVIFIFDDAKAMHAAITGLVICIALGVAEYRMILGLATPLNKNGEGNDAV